MFKDGCLQRPRHRRIRHSGKQRKIQLKELRRRRKKEGMDGDDFEDVDGFGAGTLRRGKQISLSIYIYLCLNQMVIYFWLIIYTYDFVHNSIQ
jgi:hypothetical protein